MMKTNSPFELIPEEGEAGATAVTTAEGATPATTSNNCARSLLNPMQVPLPADATTAAAAAAAAAAARLMMSQQPQQNPVGLANAAAAAGGGGGGVAGGGGVIPGDAATILNDFTLQQRVLQMKQHQIIQRQILEHQFQRNREMLQVQQERQLHVLLQQAQMKAKEEAEEKERCEKSRLESLKQKSRQDQSAVASPEVKQHLKEFVRRRKEDAAASTGNLRAAAGVPSPATNQPILRKTASESNLLKMKSKRLNSLDGRLGASPYQRQHPAIPEATAVRSCHTPSSSTHSSTNSSPKELNSPSNSVPQDLSRNSVIINSVKFADGSSAPTSPKTAAAINAMKKASIGPPIGGPPPTSAAAAAAAAAAAVLSASGTNSKSLPNIPSAVAMNRLAKDAAGLHKRKSPPPNLACSPPSASSSSDRIAGTGGGPPLPHHGAMIVRRSKSSAILPLRKHLIEKSLMKPHTVDEEQFYYQQKQKQRLAIRPIEEVMEDSPSSTAPESMEVDPSEPPSRSHPPNFTARLGTSGLSPLVISEVGPAALTNDYFARLLPRQPLDLAVHNAATAAAAAAAAAASPATFLSHPDGDKTGLGYDPLMLRHHCTCGESARHPENPNRLLAIWNRLVESGLSEGCVRVSRRATLEEIQSCHSETHALVYGTDMVNRCTLTGSQELNRDARMGKFCRLECGGVGVDADTYWNEVETPPAVRTAVGTVIELTQKVVRGELRNGFALIRPPSHHAEFEEAMGFCYFNSVAIAAKQIRQKMPSAGRILILDWAIHHGNGTQKVFYDDPSVLYISLHRHDNGNFYPGTGGPVECGVGQGVGFNINIAWAGGLEPPMGDAEYLAAFRSVVMPVAREYDPELVIVSCGFDAAAGHPHPIGGYLVSTACFAYMTKQLRELAKGRVVLALEGGFNLDVLCDASEQCVRALAGLPIEKIAEEELHRRPCASATETLQKTLAIQTPYWDVLRVNPETALLSHLEAWERERDKSETNALNAMASLSVVASTVKEEDDSAAVASNR